MKYQWNVVITKLFGHSIIFLPIVCQINKHLQDALFTKLLDQFIEVGRSICFQRLENLI